MDSWESTPRLFFGSPEPGSGNTRALEVTELVVPNPIHAINVTSAYLFRKIGDHNAGLPTILYDKIDTVFGPKAKENQDVRGVINAGRISLIDNAVTWATGLWSASRSTCTPTFSTPTSMRSRKRSTKSVPKTGL
jgi:hypothetical protein